MLCNFLVVMGANLATWSVPFGMPPDVFWGYVSGCALLVIGLIKIINDDLPQARGIEKIMPFGRLMLRDSAGGVRFGAFQRYGGHRDPDSELDTCAHILDLSGGGGTDCGGAEHRAESAVAFGGHTCWGRCSVRSYC